MNRKERKEKLECLTRKFLNEYVEIYSEGQASIEADAGLALNYELAKSLASTIPWYEESVSMILGMAELPTNLVKELATVKSKRFFKALTALIPEMEEGHKFDYEYGGIKSYSFGEQKATHCVSIDPIKFDEVLVKTLTVHLANPRSGFEGLIKIIYNDQAAIDRMDWQTPNWFDKIDKIRLTTTDGRVILSINVLQMEQSTEVDGLPRPEDIKSVNSFYSIVTNT